MFDNILQSARHYSGSSYATIVVCELINSLSFSLTAAIQPSRFYTLEKNRFR